MKTVAEMVREYLEAHGYDGLYNVDGECACLKDDLAPCCEMSDECTAGYLLKEKGEFDFQIGSKEQREAEEENR